MPAVENYSVMFIGTPVDLSHARISLYGRGPEIAFIRFIDPGRTLARDYLSGDIINMHLPSAMLGSVLDVLRNEKPLYISYIADPTTAGMGMAFFGTAPEPAGEAE